MYIMYFPPLPQVEIYVLYVNVWKVEWILFKVVDLHFS